MAMLVPAVNASTEQEFLDRCKILRSLAPPLVQIDVADGILGVPRNFAVPSLAVKELLGFRLDIHLMVRDAVGAVEEWRAAAPARLTIHCEALSDPRPLLAEIGKGGAARGLALGPDTPVEAAAPYLSDIDFLLLVAVPPGRSGQPFRPQTIERVRSVRERHAHLNIGVDGGVSGELIPALLEAGVTTVCAASAIFDAADPRLAYEELRRLVES